MKQKLSKRVFTPTTLLEITGELARDLPTLPSTFTSGRVSAAFRERILLAVTSVNRFRYCQWMHTDLAVASGITTGDVAALLGADTQNVPENEKAALVYALHYAETNRNPDPAQRAELVRVYGEATARDIENYSRLIFFSNLTVKTLYSFFSRLRGEPSSEGNAVFEGLFAALSAPVLLSLAAISKNSVNPLASMAHG